MVEAVGLAASVAGLLSLGLQVTGGIATYLDALENRQDELASVKRQNNALSAALDTIKSATSRFQSQPHDGAVTTSIQSCEAELQSVEVLLAELANCDTSTWRQRLRSAKKKLSYAFDRSKVQQIAQRLHHANEILQLTLTGLDLDLSGSSADKLTAIESTARSHASELLLLRSEMAAGHTAVTDIRNQIPLLHTGIDATSHLVVSHSAITSNLIQESSRVTQHGVEHSHNSLQLTLGLQMEKMERLEKLLQNLQSNSPRSQPVETLACRAASKPAVLKELCDSVQAPGREPMQHISLEDPSSKSGHEASGAIRRSQLNALTRNTCICSRPYRLFTHRQIQLGHFQFSQEWENHGHWPSCPLSKGQCSKKERREAGLKYTGLSGMLQSVVSISFAMTSGAGGCSIGPSFTYYPTVDPNSDPAFLVFRLMYRVIRSLQDNESIETFLAACIRKLEGLFDEKKVWPTAETLQDGNLMHQASSLVQPVSLGERKTPYLDVFRQLIKILLGYGVPAITYNSMGESPIELISCWGCCGSLEVIELLVQANFENKPLSDGRNRTFPPKPHGIYHSWYKSSRNYAEACECGPLSMAVICNRLFEVNRILDRSPESLSEVNIYGQSPIHLAASKLSILKCLLKVAKHHQLNQRDNAGKSPLETAISLSSDLCVNGSSTDICHGCACAACVELLLAAGSEIRMNRAGGIKTSALENFLDKASEMARRRYILHLRGQQTRQLLPPLGNARPLDHPHISGATFPSINASTVVVEEQSTDFRDSDNGKQLAWVYEEISDIHQADLFYDSGFRPHSSIFVHLLPGANPSSAYFCWLLQHGADLHSRWPTELPEVECNQKLGVFGAHWAFYLLGYYIEPDWLPSNSSPRSFDAMKEWWEITAPTINANLKDGCECHCSTLGCVPFLYFLKGIGDFIVGSTRSYFQTMDYHYRICGTESTILTYKVAIRYMTFQALGLVHTCCEPERLRWGYDDNPTWDKGQGSWLEEDETEIINKEQAPLLRLHEELVSEFQEKATEYIKDEPEAGSCFALFLSEYWIVRIREELEKLKGADLTDEERRGAEEIGVRWCEPPDDDKRVTNPYDEETVEHWFFKLDSICPELNEPWPEELQRGNELY